MNNDTFRPLRVVISGGGTGGHIFPALSIADQLKAMNPQTEILFVGAEGRMEMEKVPAAGYKIEGLPIAGLRRKFSLSNFALPFKIWKSVSLAGRILDGFRPDVVVGVGGYASAPLLWSAQRKGLPTLIQEQNSYAGLTNKILGKKADRICVAYPDMNRFFPAEKIVITGNPIRKEIVPATEEMKKEAVEFYNLDPSKRHILVVGGSLGSGSLNKAICEWIEKGMPQGEDYEILWQCGKYYKEGIDKFMEEHGKTVNPGSIRHFDFIKRMDLAYAVADLVVSRSGASSISELCAAGKPAIFVPSPNVAEDHQTHNAKALTVKSAGLLVADGDVCNSLMALACEVGKDDSKLETMSRNILQFAKRDAAESIAKEIYSIIGGKK